MEEVAQEIVSGDNLFKNPTFDNNGQDWAYNMITTVGTDPTGVAGEWQFQNGEAKAVVTSLNSNKDQDWTIALKQENLTLYKGCTYAVKATLTSTTDRKIKFASMNSTSDGQHWYVKEDPEIVLKANVPNPVTYTVSVDFGNRGAGCDTDKTAYVAFNLGKHGDADEAAGTITIKNISMVKISGTEPAPGGEEGGNTPGDEPGTTPTKFNGIIFKGSQDINDWGTMWAIPNVDWTQVEAGSKIAITADMIEGQGYASFHVVDGAKIDNQLLSDQGWDYASGGTQTKTIVITQEMLDVVKSTGLSIQGWGFTIKKVVLAY